MGFSKREYWSGLPCPSSGDLPYPGIEPRSPALWQTLYRLSHQGSPFCWQGCKIWMSAICMQTSFPPCMLGVVPLIEGLAGGEVTWACTAYWGGLPLLWGCHCPVRVRSLVVGAGTPRSVSELSFWSATSGRWDWSTAAGREGLSFPPRAVHPCVCSAVSLFARCAGSHAARLLDLLSAHLNHSCGCDWPSLLSGIVLTGLPASSYGSQAPGLLWLCRTAPGAMEAAQTVAWPHPYVCVPAKPTVANARLLSVVGALVHSDGRQGLSLQSQWGWCWGWWGGDRCRSKVPTAERRVQSLLLSCTGLGRLGRACGEVGGKGSPGFFHKHALSWSPLRPSLRPFRLSLCSWQQSSPHAHPPNPGFQHPASSTPAHMNLRLGGAGLWHRPSMRGSLCPAWLLCSPLSPWNSPSVPADLPTRKRGFPRLRNLSSFLHRGAGPFPFPLCFLLSCLVAWGFSYPFRCLKSSASVQHVLCENCPVPDVPGERWTPHAPIALSWPLTPPSSVFFFFSNRGGRMVRCSLPSKIEAED